MQQNPALNKLFHEVTAVSDPNAMKNLQPMSDEKRQFLEDALREATGDRYAELKKAIATLKSNESNDGDRTEALELIQMECEELDVANDLDKLDGFDVVVEHIYHTDPETRMNAAWVIGTALQNNEPMQQLCNQKQILPKLLQHMASEDDVESLQKQLLCVSGMVKHNKEGLSTFEDQGGLTTLCQQWCTHNENKIQKKAAFLLFSILHCHAVCFKDNGQGLVADSYLLVWRGNCAAGAWTGGGPHIISVFASHSHAFVTTNFPFTHLLSLSTGW
eukprot:TRINITY_DN62652_c0_g1_i1.p1 TRINITY_DN62652_c0_g1~~TRINITY_DN62652_c0_g1_i1.p1  ORF type:complete len:293 (+),score=28.65 TRINITY_DN62652_c0_g1_i1:55-879(+)